MTEFYMLANNVIVQPLFNKTHTAQLNLIKTMAFDFKLPRRARKWHSSRLHYTEEVEKIRGLSNGVFADL